MSSLQNRHVPVTLAVTAAALVLIGGVYVSTTIGLGRAVQPQPDATAAPTLDVIADLTPGLTAGEQPILSGAASDPTEAASVEDASAEGPATSRFLPFRIVGVAEGAGPEGSFSSDGDPSVGSGASVGTDVDSTEPLGVSQPDDVELAETPAPTPAPEATATPAPEATATPTPPSVSSSTGGVTPTPSAATEATPTPAPTATALVSEPPPAATPTATATPVAAVAPPPPPPPPPLLLGGPAEADGVGVDGDDLADFLVSPNAVK